MRYPPAGIRGVAGLTRASRFGRVEGYAGRAEQELCLLVQVETRQSLDAIEEIAAVDGVDGIFIGPGDRSEEHTSELQSLMRLSYAVFCLKKKNLHRYVSERKNTNSILIT